MASTLDGSGGPPAVLAIGGYASPGAVPTVNAIDADDLDACIETLIDAAARSTPVVAVCGPADERRAGHTLHLGRTAVPDAAVVLHCSALPPLGRHMLVSMVGALCSQLSLGEVVAALPRIEASMQSLAVLASVTRLEAPAPRVAQHVMSWLPSSSFLVEVWPPGAVRRITGHGAGVVPPPAPVPEPERRVLGIAGAGPSARAAARAATRVEAALPAAATLRLEPSAEGVARWGTRGAVEYCLAPLDLADVVHRVRQRCRPCAWCGAPTESARCPVCGYRASETPAASPGEGASHPQPEAVGS